MREEHLNVFDCAFKAENGVRSIPWKAHVAMMAAAQPFLSGAISKTVNMPNESTTEDIAEAYIWGWELGLKALAIYRDGSKFSQPLSTSKEGDKEESAEKVKIVKKPRRERLPDTRQSVTHKFNVAGHEGYITVGLYKDGRPGEVFITMAKEGSTVGGLMDCFGTAISLSLQYGVPLPVLVEKFSYARFEPMGHTTNPDIRIAKSVVDYIFRWMGMEFMTGYREDQLGLAYPPKPDGMGTETVNESSDSGTERDMDNGSSTSASAGTNGETKAKLNGASANGTSNGQSNGSSTNGNGTYAVVGNSNGNVEVNRLQKAFESFQTDAPSCDGCGSITVRNGNCYLCHNCGNSLGCS